MLKEICWRKNVDRIETSTELYIRVVHHKGKNFIFSNKDEHRYIDDEH
jgi:hypothetical protein